MLTPEEQEEYDRLLNAEISFWVHEARTLWDALPGTSDHERLEKLGDMVTEAEERVASPDELNRLRKLMARTPPWNDN